MKLLERITNPEIFEENRLAAHSDHVIYKSVDEYILDKSSFYVSLNGKWKFSYAPCPDMALEEFYKDDFNCKNWDSISVPAHIQLEGYDSPQYANVEYPWEGTVPVELGEVPKDFNPISSYVKYFTLPKNYGKNPIILHLDGVEQACEIWLNGKYIGYSEDSFTPAEFDLTPMVREGENKLAIRVYKWASSAWLEDQDFFRFSGIFRDVYIYQVPDFHLSDIKVNVRVLDDYKGGKLNVDVSLIGYGELRLSLFEYKYDFYDGKIAQKNLSDLKEIWHQEISLDENSDRTSIDASFDKVKLWSAEKPNLYLLAISLFKDQKLIEFIPQLIGFRRFEIENGLMKLNGKRIVFNGVNRHEFSCDRGRVLSKENILKDVINIKRNNINAIRTSHYPNTSYIYKLCDIFGLYMIDETNLETHGTWGHYGYGKKRAEIIEKIIPGSNPKWLGAVLDRASSMYERDKNHPSILMWSCGNESSEGEVIYKMSQFFREKDDSRLVHYEGVSFDSAFADSTDIYSQMYTPASKVEKFLEENKEKPFILCEYTHSMGNSNGAMHKYIELSERLDRYQGGFIWDYADQALRTKNVLGEEYMGYGGDFGDRPHSGNFSGNGIVFADHSGTPKLQTIKYNYQQFKIEIFEDKFSIENKSLFINANEYSAVEKVFRNGKLISIHRFEIELAPLSKAEFELPITLPEGDGEFSIIISLELKEDSIWAKAGYEIAFSQAVFGKFDEIDKERQSLRDDLKDDLVIMGGPLHLGVKGRDFSVHFNKIVGGLDSYKYGGKEMIKGIVLPNFWRAPLDNDYGNFMPQRYAQWKLASKYITDKPIVAGLEAGLIYAVQNDGYVEISYGYIMPTKPVSSCKILWKIFADGTVEATLSYDINEELADMPEFGFIMRMPKDYNRLSWYGLGKENTYSDLRKGAKLGIYENKVEDNFVKYLRPQESGAKLDVRYATLKDKNGSGLMFWGDKIGFSALPYTPHEIENAYHGYELPRYYQNVVRVFSEQMGVAGDDSWGSRTHPEYLVDIKGSVKTFTFRFCGI